jgi:hypothetical protein
MIYQSPCNANSETLIWGLQAKQCRECEKHVSSRLHSIRLSPTLMILQFRARQLPLQFARDPRGVLTRKPNSAMSSLFLPDRADNQV